MRPGEIYLAQFPFGDVPGMKLRPVLLITGTLGSIPEVLVAYIQVVLEHGRSEYERKRASQPGESHGRAECVYQGRRRGARESF